MGLLTKWRIGGAAIMDVVEDQELINNDLKWLNRWLKSNKIDINADNTQYMLFSYNENVNFPIIKIGNNIINGTFVTKLLGIHLDQKFEFCK